MKILKLILSSLLLSCISVKAVEADVKPKKKLPNAHARAFTSEMGDNSLSSKGGAFITGCNIKSKKCYRGKLPKKLGKVNKIIQGNFVERTTASWIAVTVKAMGSQDSSNPPA